ncbi:MAG TPA: S9 family peptidase [Terracidiphilus sp.]|nr:S9 family peptidase [Terracidiphilus sp.]
MLRAKRAAVILCLISLVSCPAALESDTVPSPHLTEGLDQIFNKGGFWGKYVQLAWENNGDAYTILEPAADGKGTDIVAYETGSGKRTVQISAAQLTPEGAKGPLEIWDYSWSANGKKLLVFTNGKKVWREYTRGDYWVYDTTSATPEGRLTKVGGDAPESSLMFATFSPDGSRVAWVRANNIYVEELATKKIAQLTTDGSADIINGTSDWVNEEELFLRNCIRWSPDSRQIAYWQFDQSGVGEYTLINDTDQEYPATFKYKYPQPGTTNSAARVGIVPAAGGPTQWVRLAGDPRQNYVAQMDWAGNSDGVLLEYLNRAQNTNQFIWANAQTGEARVVTEDTDKDWVDVFSMDWVEKGKGASPAATKDALFLSERDGWRHAYRMDLKTGQPRLVTDFAGDVLEKSAVDQEGGWFYFLASPDDPVRQYLYRSRLDGKGSPERVTPSDEPGVHAYDIAPNGKWAVHRYSTADRPTRIEIVSLPDHKLVRPLVNNDDLAAKVQGLLSSKTDFFKVPVANGVTLDGYMIKPPDFDPKKKYPVVANVYGEPAGATVRDRWRGRFRALDGLIAEEGYLVVSFDNEGTPSPKGRAWRKSVYGAIGMLSSAEQAQAIQELARERPYIDTARMAIWGDSGGGSNTLNLMFRYPGVYSTGIAMSPVADESHYDSIYQERYMGLPQVNVKGYHDGSPINFAEGLQGHLLIIHGSGDDNVHYQGSEVLINKLVELGKPFDFMEYPNRTHALSEGKGTSFHVFSTLTRYVEEHVPPGGVAR